MAKRKCKRGVVKGMTASLKYVRRENRVVLTIRGRTHAQAEALYLFSSMFRHPAVKSGIAYSGKKRRDGQVISSDLIFELRADPSFKQARLEEPGAYWLPPEDERP